LPQELIDAWNTQNANFADIVQNSNHLHVVATNCSYSSGNEQNNYNGTNITRVVELLQAFNSTDYATTNTSYLL